MIFLSPDKTSEGEEEESGRDKNGKEVRYHILLKIVG